MISIGSIFKSLPERFRVHGMGKPIDVKAQISTREQLLHALYEAAELEHNLMCTYLYAAFSLRDGEAEGLSAQEAAAVKRWRRAIIKVATEEMGHLATVWNITSALGGSPRFGRGNFPLDPGMLPAGVVVKLAPFNEAVLQHFIYLERPEGTDEPDGAGFEPAFIFTRGVSKPRLTPMGVDYETVGTFYATLSANLRAFVQDVGDAEAFCGDPALQLSQAEVELLGLKPVICLKTALAAFTAIVEQGEGAPAHSPDSHYLKFTAIRDEMAVLKAANPAFQPAHPVALNPVLRPPVNPAGRVWIEDEDAARTVDLANTGYALMLRLLAYSFVIPRPQPEKALAVDLAVGLMHAVTFLAERAARLPAGPSNPHCNAGMTFSTLRDAASLPPGNAARRFFIERFSELAAAARKLDRLGDERTGSAARHIGLLATRAERGFMDAAAAPWAPVTWYASAASAATQPADEPDIKSDIPAPALVEGVEHVEGERLTLIFDGKKCIHSRHCVTGAPTVFQANVKGEWIRPDAVSTERLIEVAHACPSGAIRYQRKDGGAEEAPPPVNLIAVREAGPYAVHADMRLDGEAGVFRATLCRCGASRNKPYCDGSHHEVGFTASGEPSSRDQTEMLSVRDGPLAIELETDGPLQVRGNLEIVSGTGRVVARLTRARLCRCGASKTKPFCDGSHALVGFKST